MSSSDRINRPVRLSPPNPLQPVRLKGEPEKALEPRSKPVGTPLYTEGESRRRTELAGILWGEPEEPQNILTARVQRPGTPPPASAVVPGKLPSMPMEAADQTWYRSTRRRQCSFPGILRVMIPELSFQPRMLAVRVVDISRTGSRMETRQITADLLELLTKEPWHARLEALVPGHERLAVAGRIAWVDFSPEVSCLGLRFETPCESVDDFFTGGLNSDTSPQELTVPSPLLDPFPTVTKSAQFAFHGRARDAERVVVRNRGREFSAEVVAGRFECTVPLTPNMSNFLTFTAVAAAGSSIPTPVCIVHKADARDTISYHAPALSDQLDIDKERGTVTLRVHGAPRRFFAVLDRIARAMEHAEDVHLTVEMKGDVAELEKKLDQVVDRPITGIVE